MIQFIGVSKNYKSVPKNITALDKVSFEIKPGEFVFLVGHSGSGKTTILRHLIREELPTDGRIFFDDQDITRLNRAQVYKLRRKIGIIFQDYKLIEDKTAEENVSFAMEAAGYSRKEINETVPYVLDIVNLNERSRAFPRQLSGGEKQRVAIARAIANNPKVLIADEPTGNLDPNAAWDIVQILGKINKWGTTVIMSTHDEEIVNSLQKRVLKMDAGKLIRDDKQGKYDDTDIVEQIAKIKIESSSDRLTEDTPISEDDSEKPEDNDSENSKKDQSKEEKTDKPKEDNDDDSKKESKKKTVKTTLLEADKSDLSQLKISQGLIDKLKENGYADIEDILTAGVGKVNKSLTKPEITELAKAVKKFLTTE